MQRIRSLPLSRCIPQIGLGLLIFLTLVLNIIWIQTDEQLGTGSDPTMYIIKTLTFTDKLESDGLNHFFSGIKSLSLSGRPPLYQLLSVPFMVLFGHTMDTGLMVNMLFQVLLLLSVFKIGQMISSARAGLLAAFLSSVYPPLVQLSRLYRPHYAIPACIAFSLWMLILLVEKRAVKNAWGFVLSLGFGAFIHPIFATMFFIPAAIFSLYVLFVQVEPRKPINFKDFVPWLGKKLMNPLFLHGYLPAVLLAGGIVAGWYFLFGSPLLEKLQTVSSNQLAQFRGFDVFTKGFKNIPTGFYWYLLTMPYAISNVFTVLFGIGLVISLIRRRFYDWFLLISFIGAYIYPASLATKTWMQFAGILPIMAVITAVGVSELKPKRLSWAFIFLILIMGVFVYSTVNWGTSGVGLKLAGTLGAPLEKGKCLSTDQVFCPRPAQELIWPIDEILKAIARDVQKNGGCKAVCYSLVVERGNDFTAPALTYYLWQKKPTLKGQVVFNSLGSIAFGIQPFDYDMLLNSTYILYVTPRSKFEGIYINAANAFLVASPPSFVAAHRRITKFVLQNGTQRVILIKRIKPLTAKEAEDTIRSVQLDEKFKYQQYQVLLPLYEAGGRLEKALWAYQKALEYRPSDTSLYFGLARVYDALGQVENAASAYRQVIAIAPNSHLALLAQAWLDSH